MEWIDTHTHIADEAFLGDKEAVIGRAMDAGVGVMLQADIDSGERGHMLELVDSHPGVLFPMAGLYPGSVNADWQDEVEAVIKCADTRNDIVAIGEIGLDYHYDFSPREKQREVFAEQLRIADETGLPVSLHLREAHGDARAVSGAWLPHCVRWPAHLPQGLLHARRLRERAA